MKKQKDKPLYKIERNTWKESPGKVLFAIGVIVFSYVFLYFFGNQFFAILGIVFPFISFTEIFFPMKYYLFEDYLIVDRYFFKIKKNYSYYKKVYRDNNGVFLSPYRFATRMENFRGILIRARQEQREEIFNFLDKKFTSLLNKNTDK